MAVLQPDYSLIPTLNRITVYELLALDGII